MMETAGNQSVSWCDVIITLSHCAQVIHCLLVYDIIRRLVDSFTEREVELLLLLLKSQCSSLIPILRYLMPAVSC